MHDLSRGLIVVTGGAGLIGSGVIWVIKPKKLKQYMVMDEEVSSGPKENLKNLSFQKQTNPQDFRELVKKKIPIELDYIQTNYSFGSLFKYYGKQ